MPTLPTARTKRPSAGTARPLGSGKIEPAFDAAYSGPNSLLPQRETSHSFTATAAVGARPWHGGELYVDGELVRGVPLSGLVGMGGLTNGELQKTAGSHPAL